MEKNFFFSPLSTALLLLVNFGYASRVVNFKWKFHHFYSRFTWLVEELPAFLMVSRLRLSYILRRNSTFSSNRWTEDVFLLPLSLIVIKAIKEKKVLRQATSTKKNPQKFLLLSSEDFWKRKQAIETLELFGEGFSYCSASSFDWTWN